MLACGVALYLLLVWTSAIPAPRFDFHVPQIVVSFLGSALPILISVINSSVIPAISKPLGRVLLEFLI